MPVSRSGLKRTVQRVLATPDYVRREPDCENLVLMAAALPVVDQVLHAWGQRLLARATEVRCLTGRRPTGELRGGTIGPCHVRAAANELWQGKTQPPRRVEWIAQRRDRGVFVDLPPGRGRGQGHRPPPPKRRPADGGSMLSAAGAGR